MKHGFKTKRDAERFANAVEVSKMRAVARPGHGRRARSALARA
jgi:hypothetical protein